MTGEQVTDRAQATLRERKKQRAHQALYDAALELLAERSYDEVSVGDICARAEVSRATFFRFYGSKAGLLAEFNRRLTELARAAIQDRLGSSGAAEPVRELGAVERLRILQDTLASRWTTATPGARKMALAFVADGTIAMLTDGRDAVHHDLLLLVTDIVQQGQATGELTTRLAPGFAAWLIVTGLAAATCTWLTEQSDTDLHQTTAHTLDALLLGMTHHPQ